MADAPKMPYFDRLLSDLGDLSTTKALALWTGLCFFLNVGWMLALMTIVVVAKKEFPPADVILALAQFLGQLVAFGTIIYSAGKVLGIGGGALTKWLEMKAGKKATDETTNS